MAKVTGIAIAGHGERQLELVATSDREGSRDTVWHARQTDPAGNEWTGWQPFGRPGGGAGAPALLQRRDDLLDVAVIGRDQSIWRRFEAAPGRWSDWASLDAPGGESFLGSLAFTENHDRRLEVFAHRHDGSAWHRWQRSAESEGDWSGWSPFGLPDGAVREPLTMGSDTRGRLEAFAPAAAKIDGTTELWHRWQHPPGNGWSPWTSLKAPGGNREPGVAVLAKNADGRLEAFTVAGDGAVWHRWQRGAGDPGSWEQPWHLLGDQDGGFTELAVERNGRGRLTVVAVAQNGRDLWQLTQDTPGGGWGSWSPLPSVPTGTVASPLLYPTRAGGLGLFLLVPSTGGLYQLIQPAPDLDWTPGRRWPPP
jgi:hypothetical protein